MMAVSARCRSRNKMADATEIDISCQSTWPSTTIATTWQQKTIIILFHCRHQHSNVYSVNMLKWLIRYDNICVFSRIDIGIRLANSRTILDLELWFFYLRPSSNWGYREQKDNMIIIAGHTCTLIWFIITTITRRFKLLFFFMQTDSPRLILFTAMPMGFRKKCKQSAISDRSNLK